MKTEELLAKVNGEAEELDQEESTTPDSPSDTEEKEEEPSQEGDTTEETQDKNTSDEDNIPFHKHPRWQQKQKEVEDLKQRVDELSTKPKEEAPLNAGEESLPQWVLGLAQGQDTPEVRAWYKQYQQSTKQERDSIRQDVLKEIKQEQEKKEQEVTKWNDWVEEETTRVLDGEKGFTKNELLKVANDFQPIDEKGNISFEKALQILKMQKQGKDSSTEQKKKIAASTTSGGKTSDGESKSFNPHSLRNQDFYDIAQNK